MMMNSWTNEGVLNICFRQLQIDLLVSVIIRQYEPIFMVIVNLPELIFERPQVNLH